MMDRTNHPIARFKFAAADYREAVDIFGTHIVNQAIDLVEASDPDGAYTTFLDEGMDEHAGVVEHLYFK